MSQSMMDKTRQSSMVIRNLPSQHGSRNSLTVVGNHGYPSVEKMVVDGNCAAKVTV